MCRNLELKHLHLMCIYDSLSINSHVRSVYRNCGSRIHFNEHFLKYRFNELHTRHLLLGRWFADLHLMGVLINSRFFMS